jgi:hypothetical protein
MAKLANIELTGKSGTKYAFAAYPRTDTFKALGAVYFMTKRTIDTAGTGTHTWVYVGETSDLSDRPLNHERKDCFDKQRANCVLLYLEEDRTKRLNIETDLRQAYNPPCNQQ